MVSAGSTFCYTLRLQPHCLNGQRKSSRSTASTFLSLGTIEMLFCYKQMVIRAELAYDLTLLNPLAANSLGSLRETFGLILLSVARISSS